MAGEGSGKARASPGGGREGHPGDEMEAEGRKGSLSEGAGAACLGTSLPFCVISLGGICSENTDLRLTEKSHVSVNRKYFVFKRQSAQ